MSDIDLSKLAVKREAAPTAAPRPRHVVSRFVFPAAIALSFAGMLAWAARDQWAPSKPVTVTPVLVQRGEVTQSGAPLFQTAGWVEPRPSPMLVAALADGVVQKLLVVEGQDVRAEEPVARLIDTEAKFAVEQAEATVQLRQAELASAQSEVVAARQRLERPLHLAAAQADAESALARAETELAKVPFQTRAAKSRLEYAQQNLDGKRAAEKSLSERIVQQAQTDFDSAQAELHELMQRSARLEREIAALRSKHEALAQQRRLLVEETRAVADATAKQSAAEARARQAEIELKQTRLQLSRTVVLSPVAGRVMELLARPGVRLGGTALQGAHAVVSLYDPQQLQVRADVRLEDVPRVQPGQAVEIETASAKGPLRGTVLRITSSANVQKNTLEVKVGIDAPPATIRPEMLVTATFLAPATTESAPTERRVILAPQSLVADAAGEPTAWVVDERGLAQHKKLKLGKRRADPFYEVVEGLAPTDKLIVSGREGLQPGDRVRITGEDSAAGTKPE